MHILEQKCILLETTKIVVNILFVTLCWHIFFSTILYAWGNKEINLLGVHFNMTKSIILTL